MTRPIVRAAVNATPTELGAYTLYERVGTGGMATVYRARRTDEPDARDVAVKRLHPHIVDDEGAVASFVKEVRIAYLLDHPVIRRVFSLCRAPGELFMTMEYVDGESLSSVLRRVSAAGQQLPVCGALAVIERLCEALHYAHELVDEVGSPAGFVHRDVSPSNLILSKNGRLKLIDMGVARANANGHATNAGVVKGKYGYMAPEVMWSRPFDRRADVFSVGVVAWELLTAHKLYPVRTPPVDIARVRARPVDPPSKYNASCSPELDAIILHALAAEPSRRWATCAHLAEALRSAALPISPVHLLELSSYLHGGTPRPERRSARRLARGTTAEHAVCTVPSAVPVPVARRRSRRSAGLAMTVALLIAAGLGAGFAAHLLHDGLAGPAESALDVSSSIAKARTVADAGVPVVQMLPADASDAVTVAASEVTRIGGPWPRSRTSAYAYRASLCIDEGGTVISAGVLEGPPRLEGRIERTLLRWRYAPYTSDGRARPACFEIESYVQRMVSHGGPQ